MAFALNHCGRLQILYHYKGLFTENGHQKSQLIIATHSEGVFAKL